MTEQKAGRRIQRARVDQARGLRDRLNELASDLDNFLEWAQYLDGVPPELRPGMEVVARGKAITEDDNMSYSKLSEAPASLRGIEPPITLAQANAIAEWADAMEEAEDGPESPWAAALAQFKKLYEKTADGWKKKEKEEEKSIDVDGESVLVADLIAVYKITHKSVSLDQWRNQVSETWRKKFQKQGHGAPTTDVDYWPKDILDDAVIAEGPEGLFSYPYTTDEEGAVEFGEPVKVHIQYVPIEAGKSLAIKALREEDGGVVVGGYMALWGDAERKDLQGDYFTPETELWLDAYKSAPALFHHGLDQEVGLVSVGHRVKSETRDIGLWVEDWLNKSSQYWSMVKPLLEAEALYYSPGSAPHLVKRAEDGRLLSFPVVEDTLTPVPAQHRLLPVSQIKAVYQTAGIELPAEFAEEPEQTDGRGDTGVLHQELELTEAKAANQLILGQIVSAMED